MAPIRIALVGVGKIVRDQHVPVLAASPDFELVATASPHSALAGVPGFTSLGELLAQAPGVDAIAVTSPTAARHDIARDALLAGRHVLLEKPPCTTLTELDDLRAVAEGAGAVLYASWHSRHAPQVRAARVLLHRHPPSRIEVVWREDVRRWHPGQEWVWEPGGLGVFDPGVNALSILTEIAPWRVHLRRAELHTPAGRHTPITARLTLSDPAGTPITAEFDWTGEGLQTWEIRAETDAGLLRLFEGGARLEFAGASAETPAPDDPAHAEYIGVYRHFAELIGAGRSDVDDRPLRLAADAFLVAQSHAAAAFDWRTT